MLRTLYRFALPGGRRVIVAYFPPEKEKKAIDVPAYQPDLVKYDRLFAQAGLFSGVPEPRWIPTHNRLDTPVPRGKRVR